MLWLSLRTGFANTAFVLALALLPLMSLASLSPRYDSPRIEKAALDTANGPETARLPLAAIGEHRVN